MRLQCPISITCTAVLMVLHMTHHVHWCSDGAACDMVVIPNLDICCIILTTLSWESESILCQERPVGGRPPSFKGFTRNPLHLERNPYLLRDHLHAIELRNLPTPHEKHHGLHPLPGPMCMEVLPWAYMLLQWICCHICAR